MINNPKTKEELLKELEKLKLENASLKALYEQDLTERNQVKELLRESDDSYRDLVENSSDMITTHDLDGNILSLNKATIKIIGYSKEEIINMNLRNIIAPEYRKLFNAYLDKIKKTGEANGHMLIHTKTGEKRIWEYHNTLRTEGIAEPIVRGMAKDVTEQKRADLEQQVFYEITQGVTATANLDELLKLIHQSLGKVLYADNCFVAFYDPNTELFSFPYFVDKFDTTPEPLAMRKSCTAYVFRAGKPLLIAEELFQQLLEQNEVELVGSPSPSWIGVPLKTPSRTMGVLVLQHYEEENIYSEHDVKFLNSVGSQIALVIERKRAEDALKESELRMRLIVEGTPFLFFYTQDINAKITYISPSVEKITGHPVNEWLNSSHWFVTDSTINNIAKEITKVHLTGKFTDSPIIVELFHADKHPILLEVYENPIIIDGIVIGLQGVAHDITERKKSEEGLQKLNLAIHNSQEVVFMTNLEGTITYINPEFTKLYEYTTEEVVGKTTPRILNSGLYNKEYYKLFWDTLLNKQGIPKTEYVNRCKNGKLIYVEGSADPIINNNGDIIGFLGIHRDISERKRAEEEIKERNEELSILNAEKDKFFSIIAHDLRSPFHGFISLTEMMSEDIHSFSTEELSKLTHEMSQSAQNLFNLLQNLLDWAQFKKGSFSFTPQMLSLSTIVSECIEQINQIAIQKRITIINEVRENQKVFADKIMINSILGNFLSNAVKFTNSNGVVTIKAKKTEDQMIEISIIDTGVGMPKSMVEKLFKIGEKTGRKGTDGELSTGLGLLLCKEFIDKNGGKIWVESEEGVGSTFYFTLRSQGS